jgi:hypothetical protein
LALLDPQRHVKVLSGESRNAPGAAQFEELAAAARRMMSAQHSVDVTLSFASSRTCKAAALENFVREARPNSLST